MERARQVLRWDQRSEIAKTSFIILVIVGVTLTGFGVFALSMGTSSPLVVVESYSMLPTFTRGDLLVLKAQAPEDIDVGDIIVYNAEWNDDPIVHRVVEREFIEGEYRYYTQGDNNNVRDQGYRLYEDIVGEVILAIPLIGHVTLFLHEPLGLAIVIVILAALIIIPEIIPKKEEEEKKHSEEQASNA